MSKIITISETEFKKDRIKYMRMACAETTIHIKNSKGKHVMTLGRGDVGELPDEAPSDLTLPPDIQKLIDAEPNHLPSTWLD